METEQPNPRKDARNWMPRPGFLYALGFVVAVSCGVALDRVQLGLTMPSRARADFRLMAQAWNQIERHYVDRAAIKPTTMTYAAIGGMVDALGDTGHSAFLSPTMVKQLSESERGQLQGIGAEIQMKNGRVVIVAPLDGSPAQKAGLKPDDVILKVDGKDIADLPLSRVVEHITGPPHTSVRLTILDPGTGRTKEVSIVRAAIQLHSVAWHPLPGTTTAHLRISDFEAGTLDDLRGALKRIEGDRLTGIILDLRNNPGGILDEAVAVTSQFLAGGNVLLVKNAQDAIKPVPVEKGGLATNMPVVVLINGGTASGAEIVAGALRDAHRATLVGEKTFGTGTVLQQFALADGSALLLAVEEWLTPSGESFWHKGIVPNVTVALPRDVTPLLPEQETGMTPDQLRACGDAQLLRALALLNSGPPVKETRAVPR